MMRLLARWRGVLLLQAAGEAQGVQDLWMEPARVCSNEQGTEGCRVALCSCGVKTTRRVGRAMHAHPDQL